MSERVPATVVRGGDDGWRTLKIPGVDRLMLPVFKKVIDELLKGGITAAEDCA